MRINSILASAFLLCSSLYFGQTVTFDYLAKYQCSCCNKKSGVEERVVYLSQDPNYYLLVYNAPYKKLIGRLVDLNNKKIHEYDVEQLTENGQTTFKLNYKNSQNVINTKAKNMDFTFSKKESGYDFLVFSNSKKKKKLRTYDLVTEPTDRNYFKAFQLIGVHPYENWKELQPKDNFKVKEATLKVGSKEDTMHYKLVQDKNATLVVTIPEKPNYTGTVFW